MEATTIATIREKQPKRVLTSPFLYPIITESTSSASMIISTKYAIFSPSPPRHRAISRKISPKYHNTVYYSTLFSRNQHFFGNKCHIFSFILQLFSLHNPFFLFLCRKSLPYQNKPRLFLQTKSSKRID